MVSCGGPGRRRRSARAPHRRRTGRSGSARAMPRPRATATASPGASPRISRWSPPWACPTTGCPSSGPASSRKRACTTRRPSPTTARYWVRRTRPASRRGSACIISPCPDGSPTPVVSWSSRTGSAIGPATSASWPRPSGTSSVGGSRSTRRTTTPPRPTAAGVGPRATTTGPSGPWRPRRSSWRPRRRRCACARPARRSPPSSASRARWRSTTGPRRRRGQRRSAPSTGTPVSGSFATASCASRAGPCRPGPIWPAHST